ncbi:MAG TPA: hypothetical protein DC046_10520, partial [Rhodospirillaceae bacterium]|nr:hypothetical protein [Rhodospirillaceae bacterium]
MAYLDNHTVMATDDMDELRDAVAGLAGRHQLDVRGDRTALSARIAVASFGELNLLHFGYGDVRIDVSSGEEGDDGLLFYVVTGGGGNLRRGNTEMDFSTTQGVVRDLSKSIMVTQEGLSGFALPMSKERVRRHAHSVIGADVGATPVMFDQGIDMTTPGGRQFRNTVHFVANALDGPLREMDNPILARQMEELLLTQILTLLPNNFSDAIADCATRVALPHHVKKARDYIHAHAHTALGVADIAAAAGCGYRTVQNVFKDVYGMSPMAYLRLVRLKRVHSALRNGGE